MKGISPLIAAVILIAFTLAIAGMMATWATTFVREKTGTISKEAKCIGALDISSPSLSGTNASVTVKNTSPEIQLVGIKASLIYADVSKNKEYELKDYGVTDPLPVASTDWAIIDTGDATKPLEIEVSASNCPDYPASLHFA